MNRTVFLFAVLLVIPAFTAAQTQTRERRSNDAEPLKTGSSTVRARTVGARAANHVEKQKASADAPISASANSDSVRPSTSLVKQNSVEPGWGNSSIVIRSGPGERTTPLENSSADKQKAVERSDQPVKKLVQQTSLVPVLPGTTPAAGNTSTARSLATGGAASTVVY